VEFFQQRLPNGLEIIGECNPQAYSVAVGFFVKAGARDEDDQLSGVSHFLEHMAFKGTATRSAEQVNRELDQLGAHYNAFTSEEHTVYYAAVLPECLERVVALLADILRPALRPEDFETEKQVILEEIQMYEDEPPFRADEKCRQLHFGRHPLGRSVLGSLESIRQLTVEAMRDYFSRRYSPGNIVLAAAGKFEFDDLCRCAERYCGHWAPMAVSRLVEPPTTGNGFHVLHKPTATQQYALLLCDAPSAEDPSRYAASLLAVILGDDTGSRLFWELVDPGLAEEAGMYHHEYQQAGLLVTSMCCRPEQTAENLQRLFRVYRQAASQSVSQQELQQAKNKVRSAIVLGSELPMGRLRAVGGNWLYQGEYRSVEEELQMVSDVTVDDLAALLRRYPLTRCTAITIGPLADVPPPW